MGANVGLFLFAVLCAGIGGVQGVCRHVENDDMIEYACMGGQLSDLNALPSSTGKIRISNMPIPRLTVDTFSRFGSDLWVLGCSYCQIMDIEPGAFRRLNNLQQLSLDNNHLSTVKESWLKGLDYLTFLDLNYNNIQSIEDGVFESLPSLVDLRLSGNRLECLNLASMSRLKDLRRMFITENSEFKCPNAVSAFLDSRGVSFEKDPEWRRLPADLVPVEMPMDYDTDDEETITEELTTPLPAYRERLHPTSYTPPPTVQSTSAYVPPRLYTTEEVVYRPTYNTPDWRTTSKPTTVFYEDSIQGTTTPPHGNTIRIHLATFPAQEPTTTLRSWPRFPESTSAKPDLPPYSPHENQGKQYLEEPDYMSPVDSLPLAPSPDDRHQAPSYQEPNMNHDTDLVEIDWRGGSTDPSNMEYPPNPNSGPPEYRVPSVDPPEPTHYVRPVSYSQPEMVQPASADNVYQAPYYEHGVTVHSPPLVVNQPQQEEVTPGIVPIETTTDKPLPNCPTRNLSSTSQSSIAMIVVSVFLAITGRVLVEGF